jgi:hypothetical protein
MSSTSKKSTQGRASKTRQNAKVAVQRISHEQASQLLRPRVGFEAMVDKLADIVDKYGDAFGTEGIDVELMRSSLATYQALKTQHEAALANLAGIEGTLLVNGSTSWTQFLLIYDRARSIARANGALEGELDPIRDFMKVGPRKHPTVATTTPTT